MQYKDFQNIKLSRLGMGNMRLPALDSTIQNSPIDWEKAHAIIDYALEQGVNYFDTAYVYNNGESEKCVGACMKKHDRNSFFLATKYHVGANPNYEEVFETQLERLQTDHIDFYLIHCLMDNNVDTYLTNGCIEYFLKKKEEGKISYLGFSSHAGLEALEKFADHHKWDFAQLQINYFDWNYDNTKQQYDILASRGIPVMVMEPVRGGRLAKLDKKAEELLKSVHPDWSMASWAFRFVKSLPMVQVVLSGMSNLEQLEDNLQTFADDYYLNEEEMALLMKACDLHHKSLTIPCTGCRYCTDNCPMEINIPEFITVYNKYKAGLRGLKPELEAIVSNGQPADCIGCGACMGHCPQSIDVPTIMNELAEKFYKD